METYKQEIAALHSKNIESAVNEKTAVLQSGFNSLKEENIKLQKEVKSSKNDYVKIVLAFIVAFILGLILSRLF